MERSTQDTHLVLLTKDEVTITSNGTHVEWIPDGRLSVGDKVELDSLLFTGVDLDLYGLRYIGFRGRGSWNQTIPSFVCGRDYAICMFKEGEVDHHYHGQPIDFKFYNASWEPVKHSLVYDWLEVRLRVTKKDTDACSDAGT